MDLREDDLPEGWKVGRSPIDGRSMRGLESLLGPSGFPAAWHETFAPDGTRVVLRVTEGIDAGNHLDEDGADLGEFPPSIDALIVSPGDDVFASPPDGKVLRSIRVEDIERRLAARWAAEGLVIRLREYLGEQADEPLTKPDRSDPDRFSARVALRYLQLMAQSPDPTEKLRLEVGVPHATAQRWVGDARRRGYLPPATRRRKGLK